MASAVTSGAPTERVVPLEDARPIRQRRVRISIAHRWVSLVPPLGSSEGERQADNCFPPLSPLNYHFIFAK